MWKLDGTAPQVIEARVLPALHTREAAELAKGNPHSFLHVGRPEIDLPAGTDVHSDAVYAKGVENLHRFRAALPELPIVILTNEAIGGLFILGILLGGLFFVPGIAPAVVSFVRNISSPAWRKARPWEVRSTA